VERLRTFEEMYRDASQGLGEVPWANLAPLPQLVEWLDDGAGEERGSALVVGCGYGDDAEELARRGFEVSAFDLSPTAIARARERFPESTVDYRVASVIDLPGEWAGRFDLVVEIRTLQSLPVEERRAAARSIAAAVAPGGRLWLFALARDSHQPGETRPWPVTRDELSVLEAAGLRFESRHQDPLDEAGLHELTALLRRDTPG
jgi:SAM-dependent methyltransferase